MAGLQETLDDFEAENVAIVALSSDDEAAAREMKEDEGLSFTVAYGLDPEEMGDRLGLYTESNDRKFVQPAQFILDPEGTVHLACYSSGKVGRLGAEEALEQIRSARDG